MKKSSYLWQSDSLHPTPQGQHTCSQLSKFLRRLSSFFPALPTLIQPIILPTTQELAHLPCNLKTQENLTLSFVINPLSGEFQGELYKCYFAVIN